MATEREIVPNYRKPGSPTPTGPSTSPTDSQPGYVPQWTVSWRAEPAACFYMGYFFAEALIRRDGNQTGAIQIGHRRGHAASVLHQRATTR